MHLLTLVLLDKLELVEEPDPYGTKYLHRLLSESELESQDKESRNHFYLNFSEAGQVFAQAAVCNAAFTSTH